MNGRGKPFNPDKPQTQRTNAAPPLIIEQDLQEPEFESYMNPATETKPDEIPVSKQLADMFSLLKPYRFKYGFALFLRLMANVFYTALVLNIGQFVDRTNKIEGKLNKGDKVVIVEDLI